MKTEIYAFRTWSDAIELRVIRGKQHARLSLHDFNEGELVDPTVTIDKSTAQILMDDLWRCGFRPSEGEGSAGQSAAQQKHISDLREIAFKVLKIEGKK